MSTPRRRLPCCVRSRTTSTSERRGSSPLSRGFCIRLACPTHTHAHRDVGPLSRRKRPVRSSPQTDSRHPARALHGALSRVTPPNRRGSHEEPNHGQRRGAGHRHGGARSRCPPNAASGTSGGAHLGAGRPGRDQPGHDAARQSSSSGSGTTFVVPGPDGGPDQLSVVRTDQLPVVLEALKTVFADTSTPEAAAAAAQGMRTVNGVATFYGGGGKGTHLAGRPPRGQLLRGRRPVRRVRADEAGDLHGRGRASCGRAARHSGDHPSGRARR